MKRYTLILMLFITNAAHSVGIDGQQFPLLTINIIDKNIATPLYNLSLLSEITENKAVNSLPNISSTDFEKSKGFIALREHMTNYKINTSYVIEKRTNNFFVNSNKQNLFIVTFERREYGKWFVTNVMTSKEGNISALSFTANDPILNTALSSQSDGFRFKEFPLLWAKVKDASYKLTPLNTHQYATLENVFFYGDTDEKKNQIAIASVQMAYFGPTTVKIENGWLITDFSFKDYDFNKKSTYMRPTPVEQFGFPFKEGQKYE